MEDISRIILLMEDNDDDAFITERAFNSAGVKNSIHRCPDGQAVIDYLSGLISPDGEETASWPHLVLLDLKVPRKGGLEVLAWIRKHEKFSPLVVLALTSSAEPKDVKEAHRLHVNAYLVKPTSLGAMTELARCVRQVWLEKTGLLPVAPLFLVLLGLPLMGNSPF